MEALSRYLSFVTSDSANRHSSVTTRTATNRQFLHFSFSQLCGVKLSGYPLKPNIQTGTGNYLTVNDSTVFLKDTRTLSMFPPSTIHP